MDVNEIDNLHQAKLSTSNKIKKDNGFRRILDQRLSEINAATAQTPTESKADVLERSDKILNLLDDYARGLTDPGKTLKDIEPLVEGIKKEVRLIEAGAVDSLHNDKDLERFIKDLAVIANVAVFKFHRGDYI
ncbi:MAG: hypothetical protein JSU78_02625 [Deltaproteobacteria bacterium]|jgi:hypothetical protein|nr:MAG: hypothetical protein JSU78_02625 [Deltaproteobacteria bacterium]